jgi:hypothetical protein
MKKHSKLAAPLLALALAGTAPIAAQAQVTNSGWQFEAALYGWFPAISGTTSFPPTGGGPSIDLSTGDVLDALKMAFFTAIQVRNGEWGLWTDIAYADLGGSKSGSRDFNIGGQRPPVGVTANLDLDVKSWIWTIAGTYQLKNDDAASMDLLFGARMLDISNTLDWNISGSGGNLPPLTGTKEVGGTNWDGVVGLKGRAFLGSDRRWFVPFYADIGTGESKLTWQVNAGVGYQFDWGALIGSWRYLDYDFKSGSNIQSQSFNGPLVGVVFRF